MTNCTGRKSCLGDVIKQSGYLVYSIFRIYPGVADMLLELEEGGADREEKDRSGRNQKHLHIMFMILVTGSTGHDFNS